MITIDLVNIHCLTQYNKKKGKKNLLFMRTLIYSLPNSPMYHRAVQAFCTWLVVHISIRFCCVCAWE